MNRVQDPLLDSYADVESQLDPELAEILEGYLVDLEQGLAPDQSSLLAKHPERATALREYLPWIELLYRAKPRGSGGTIATAPRATMPETLGDFRIVREIGRGGMGVVYEAEQISLQRRVALKVLPFASMLDQRQLERFKNEALAVAQLQHANIVPVYAVGSDQGLHYYAMRLIDGQTLEDVIDSERDAAERVDTPDDHAPADDSAPLASSAHRKLRIDAAARERYDACARWTIQAAEALDYAHRLGFLHRDVKPSNLLVDRDGALWVTDFGLARAPREQSITASGELLGTLRFMSPEQLSTKPGLVDRRADIYALGLTLYELLALRPAFEAPTQQALARLIESREPALLRRIDGRIPRDLENIVFKAIAKAPADRYASAQEMADDLRRYLDGVPTLAQSPTWRDHFDKWIRRHARLVAAAALALAIVLVSVASSTVLVWRARTDTQHALDLASANHARAEANLRDARSAVDIVFTDLAEELADTPGAEPARRKLLEQALAYYQKFSAQPNADERLTAETAAAHYRCGQISEQLGDDVAARDRYEESRRLWMALREQQDSMAARQGLALCEHNLALVAFRGGDDRQAARHLWRAIDLQQELLASQEDDEQIRRDLTVSYTHLGMVLGEAGRADEALAALQQALECQRDSRSPSAEARGDLAAIYSQIGYVHSPTSPAAAAQAFGRAAEAYEKLALQSPRVLRWQAELASVRGNLAALAAQGNRFDDAERYYLGALKIQRRLAERAPDVVAYARNLAVTANNFGFLLCRQQRDAEAIAQFEIAREQFARLAAANANAVEYLSRWGGVCNNLGLAYERMGRDDEARTAYVDAIAAGERARAGAPHAERNAAYLATERANLLRLLRRAGDDEAAIAMLDRVGADPFATREELVATARELSEIAAHSSDSARRRALDIAGELLRKSLADGRITIQDVNADAIVAELAGELGIVSPKQPMAAAR